MKAARNLPVVNRRQFLASTGVGALLGSAMGKSFLASELGSDHPTLTIYRTLDLVAMLIEHQSTRLLLLDGEDDLAITEVTESVTGFLRQRLDIVLASDQVLQMLPADFVDRWNVSAVYALPDKHRPFQSLLDDQALSIGDLKIWASVLPFGAWRNGSVPDSRRWYLSVRYGSACCIYSDSWDVLMAAGQPPDATVSLSITNDAQSRVSQASGMHIVAIPEDSLESLAGDELASLQIEIVRLYRNYPILIHLRPDAIILPDQG